MRLVVSLTTIPSRYGILRNTLASLCQQTEKPDAIYLNLPHSSIRQGIEYPPFDASDFPGVTVVSGCADWGPGTKLVPTVLREDDPETVIVTVDDDVEYAPYFLSRMKAALARHPEGAVGFCGWNAGSLIAGGSYDFVYEERAPHEDGVCVDVLEGYRGVAYRRGDFGFNFLNFAGSLSSEALLVDDVWISGYLHRRGVPRRVARFIPEMTLTPDDVWAVLWKQHGLNAEADGLRCLGDTEARNRRVATRFFSEKLELGCGVTPTPGYLHHDRIKHADYVDVAHDLDVLPWRFASESMNEILALDVMEHLRLDIADWLDECWRILKPGGVLVLRVPHWQSADCWIDPTHRRWFDPRTFEYWDPDMPLYRHGKIYFAERDKWWKLEKAETLYGNINVRMVKR